MSGRIFLLDESSNLIPMDESSYQSEAILQELLANHPDILAGDQINTEAPRRWLLISREMAVPGEASGSGRWSLDHLFLDQDGIPTLVEVKRSSDTRIRREVVGQMLDYAANAVAYWTLEEIRSAFHARCVEEKTDPEDVLAVFLGVEMTEADFWQRTKRNLDAKNIRMVFVADHLPSELVRIIEFLNEQMNPAEVLGVEVKQFQGKGIRTLVPRVVGLSETSRVKKSGTHSDFSEHWDEDRFFDDLIARNGETLAQTAKSILELAEERKLRIWWGKGKSTGSFCPMFEGPSGRHFLFSVWSSGEVELQFQHMREPFASSDAKWILAQHIMQSTGIELTHDKLSRRPSFPLEMLADPTALQKFFDAFDWMLREVKNYKSD